MKKWKFFINLEREEEWLNHMAKQGYKLVKKSFGYQFEPAEAEDAIIKIDYRTFKRKEDFEDYRALFEDSGWKHIWGTKHSGYQYFKKVDPNGSEDIFSDVDSKAARYKRMSEMWFLSAVCYIPIFVILMYSGSIDVKALVNPKLLYFTPGLWEKTGAEFWSAFLFETPFALFRGVLWLFFPLMILLYLVFAFKANKRYKEIGQDNHWI